MTEVIARGIFTSVPELAGRLRRYINACSANARPIQWNSDPSRRLRTNELTATVNLVSPPVFQIETLNQCQTSILQPPKFSTAHPQKPLQPNLRPTYSEPMQPGPAAGNRVNPSM